MLASNSKHCPTGQSHGVRSGSAGFQFKSEQISWMEAVAASGQRLTMAAVVAHCGGTPAAIRAGLIDVYGPKVQFNRGRNGGIVFTD
jgi:hypothetical protein